MSIWTIDTIGNLGPIIGLEDMIFQFRLAHTESKLSLTSAQL